MDENLQGIIESVISDLNLLENCRDFDMRIKMRELGEKLIVASMTE